MKIAFIVASHMYPDRIGGAEIFTFRLAYELSKKGHKVYIIAFEGKKFRSKKFKNLILCGTASNRIVKSIKERSTLLARIMMIYHLIKIRPDVCLAVMLHSALPAYIYSKILKRKLIVRYSGGDVHFISKTKGSTREYIIAKTIFDRIKVEAIQIALSSDMKRDLIKLGAREDKIVIIPNPIDEIFFKIKPNYEGGNIGFVGRLIERKGIKTLIDAFKILIKRYKSLKLILIGDGPLKNKIIEEIKYTKMANKIEITGFKPYSEIPNMLKELSIFIFPAHYGEGSPNALLQAMAAKLPIIATNINGIRDLIKDGYNGILVPPGNPRKLSEATAKLLRDKALAMELGRNAYEIAKKYSIKNIIKKYEEIIR